MHDYVKMQVMCPPEFLDTMHDAISDGGGGVIGNYTHCMFVSKGMGYFMPKEGSNPSVGASGQLEQIDEVKIEFLCARDKVKSKKKKIRIVHPYEEVPIDIIPLLNKEDFS